MRLALSFLAATAGLAACAPQRPPIMTPDRSTPPPPAASKPAATQPVAPKPAWTARAVVTDAVEVAPFTYTVLSGDTLRGISHKTRVGSEAIARANTIQPPFIIRVGQKLKIPGGRWHEVKPGETGIAIARAYGIEWNRVVRANALEEPYILRTGQRLLLPSRAEVAAMSLEQRAAAFQLSIDDLITGGEPAATEVAARTPSPAASPSRPLAPERPVVEKSIPSPTQFAWPLRGSILSRFGTKPGGRYNDGINIKAEQGATIRAAAEGTVAYVGNDIPGFGGLILIKHGGGWITAYAHAQALLVVRGQSVKQGDVIARAGQTGSVDEPQLHFEIRQGRQPVNPLDRLPAIG